MKIRKSWYQRRILVKLPNNHINEVCLRSHCHEAGHHVRHHSQIFVLYHSRVPECIGKCLLTQKQVTSLDFLSREETASSGSRLSDRHGADVSGMIRLWRTRNACIQLQLLEWENTIFFLLNAVNGSSVFVFGR